MTCTWNNLFSNNISQFQTRFPALFELLKDEVEFIKNRFIQEELILENNSNLNTNNDTQNQLSNLQILNNIFNFWTFSYSKSNHIIAKEKNTYIHSSYDPVKEVQRIFQLQNKLNDANSPKNHTTSQENPYLKNNNEQLTIIDQNNTYSEWIFAGIGLGYSPIEFAKLNNENFLIIIEPDPFFLFASMATLDWTPIFNHEKCVIITKTTYDQAITLIENLCQLETSKVITNNSLTNHQPQWFSNFFTLLQRNKQKQIINTNTLEKFSKLWLKNSTKNLQHFSKINGINIYKNMLNFQIPTLIVAAGPSLQDIIPYIKEISKRTVIIAVDTALKFLLKNNIEPDFIVLIDPQYYAACHINGLSSKNSVLITESSVYPSVLRFDCRKIVMCESLFPLGRYFEQGLTEEGTFGKINVGGSVSTSCWDFAKFINSKEIYFAGLDLGYPNKITHVKGSTFEEKTHSNSIRTTPAETAQVSILFNTQNEKFVDYEDNIIITDSKMKLFAWWFESQIAKDNHIKTYTLSKKSLKIPGIEYKNVTEILNNPIIESQKKEIILSAEKNAKPIPKEKFDNLLNDLLQKFDELLAKSKKGLSICNKILAQPEFIAEQKAKEHFNSLSEIDNFILNSDAKKVASLVFPSTRQLNKLMEKQIKYNSTILQNIAKSKIIYSELITSINKYKSNL